MNEHDTRAVLVTGASKGIGEACALRLHARGFLVFAGVRDPEDGRALVDRAGGDRMVPVRLDVVKADDIAAAARTVEDHTGQRGLAGLVNNAGIAVAGPLEFMPIDELRRQLEVNVVGQVAVTQSLMPSLRRARGRIVFMSSVAGRSSLPFSGAYGASKFAIEAIADALRVELADSGINVAVIEPGAIATPIWETSLARADVMLESMPPKLEERYGPQLAIVRRFALSSAKHGAPASRAAAAVEHALTASRPRTRYVVGHDAKTRLLLERLLPTRLRDRLIRMRLR
ncbi:MAG: SDR family NAD(P)-dependent oxidoreductase [Longimicrobiales bacterium]